MFGCLAEPAGPVPVAAVRMAECAWLPALPLCRRHLQKQRTKQQQQQQSSQPQSQQQQPSEQSQPASQEKRAAARPSARGRRGSTPHKRAASDADESEQAQPDSASAEAAAASALRAVGSSSFLAAVEVQEVARGPAHAQPPGRPAAPVRPSAELPQWRPLGRGRQQSLPAALPAPLLQQLGQRPSPVASALPRAHSAAPSGQAEQQMSGQWQWPRRFSLLPWEQYLLPAAQQVLARIGRAADMSRQVRLVCPACPLLTRLLRSGSHRLQQGLGDAGAACRARPSALARCPQPATPTARQPLALPPHAEHSHAAAARRPAGAADRNAGAGR